MNDMSLNFDPGTYLGLEKLGRLALSKSFHMREFLYSEIAAHHKLRNAPERDRLQFAVVAGKNLCEKLLEPLQDVFGRVHIRSGYRSRSVNEAGVGKHGCAADNDGFHTWDYPSKSNGPGAVACISIPAVSAQALKSGADPYAIAWWIEDHLADWSCLEFFSTPPFADELSFNIGWHERPMKLMTTWRGGGRDLRQTMPHSDKRRLLWEDLLASCAASVKTATEATKFKIDLAAKRGEQDAGAHSV